ncbi:MAG: AAA family ATPase [Thermoguttaceae bacterium]
MSNPKSSVELIALLLKSSYKLIFFCTQEEGRAELALQAIAKGRDGFTPREYFCWTETDGFVSQDGKPPEGAKKTTDPVGAFQWIIDRDRKQTPPALYVMKDLHPFISPRSGRSTVVRKLKDTLRVLEPTKSAITIIAGPQLEIPPELEKEAVIIDFELPTFSDLKAKLTDFINTYKGRKNVVIELTEDDIDALAKAAQGLTMAEAELAFAKALVADNRLDRDDVAQIIEEKKQIIRKTGILTFEEAGEMSHVGGLENLKAWLSKRKDILTERARKYKIPEPKGVMLTGVPGCGKSLCAKAMASFWSIPLLRLDMGAVFAGIVGSSEANIRKAIRCAEAMAPCILMIDEIEKGLAGSSGGGGGGDGGTSTRVFGTLLSWMNDKTCPVFVVATANEFDRLPPEMLRKGRFDEIFFVDFPHAGERATILEIHVCKRGRDPKQFDIPQLVEATKDFTGSEIEQAIVTGMIEAFADGEREFTTDDVVSGIKKTIPLIDTMQDKIISIRQRAMQCTVSASKPHTDEPGGEAVADTKERPAQPAEPTPTRGGRQLDL